MMTIDVNDVFQTPPCGERCGALALARALRQELGVRVYSAVCPQQCRVGRAFVSFHADQRRPDPGPVEAALYSALAKLKLVGGGGRGAFVEAQGETQSGLRKWRIDTARADKATGRKLGPGEAETLAHALADLLGRAAQSGDAELSHCFPASNGDARPAEESDGSDW